MSPPWPFHVTPVAQRAGSAATCGSSRSRGPRAGLPARQATDERPSAIRVVNGVECVSEGEQVAVVDPAVLDLAGQVAENAGPVLSPRRDRRGDLHSPLDDSD